MNRLSHTVATQSFKRVLREKWGLISWLAIPLMIVFLMSLMSGGGGSPKPHGRLLVTDHDESTLSQFLIGGMSQGQMAEFFTVKQVNEQEGQAQMDEGEATAWIVVEAGFMDNYLNKRPSRLRLVKNPAQTILPGMVETGMLLLVDAADYLQMLFADELNKLNQMVNTGKVNDADLVMLTLAIKKSIDVAEKTIVPPKIKLSERVVEVKPESEKPAFNFVMLMYPGAIFMSLLFASMSLAMGFWEDKANGILPRLSASPGGLSAYVNGQLLHSIMVFLMLGVVLLSVGVMAFELPVKMLPIMLFWLAFSGLLLWLLMLVFALLLPSRKSANIVVNAAVFPMAMLGGAFFPAEAMPDWLAKIGSFLPNGFLLKAIKDVLVRGQGLQEALLIPFVIGTVMIAVLWFINQKLIKRLAQGVQK